VCTNVCSLLQRLQSASSPGRHHVADVSAPSGQVLQLHQAQLHVQPAVHHGGHSEASILPGKMTFTSISSFKLHHTTKHEMSTFAQGVGIN
jgi:hypothetical protein